MLEQRILCTLSASLLYEYEVTAKLRALPNKLVQQANDSFLFCVLVSLGEDGIKYSPVSLLLKQ